MQSSDFLEEVEEDEEKEERGKNIYNKNNVLNNVL